jgi:tRNA-2-methylthio-N6-dimethylallyladenosine synthase
MARAPRSSVVVGPQAYHNLPELIAEAVEGRRGTDTDMPADAKFAALPRAAARAERVPDGAGRLRQVLHLLRRALYRGAEISRPMNDLLREAEMLVEAGAREITLLGQNVNAWGEGLDVLIRELAKLPGSARSATPPATRTTSPKA